MNTEAVDTGQRQYFATCPKGLEYLLRDELVALGGEDVREARAGVHFSGDLAIAYRACLWSRLASRILLPLAQFPAADDEALYDGVAAIDWSQHMAASGSLAIHAVSTASKLTHTRFIAQRAKDAIVDQFRDLGGLRPDVDLDAPTIRLNVRLHRDSATLSLDLSGTPLHRRGYRSGQGEAPLKENLAAAMLLRADWPQIHAQGGALLDPMCGSATLLIEAAWMAADMAPGLLRERFGFTDWRQHDGLVWHGLVEEARERAEQGRARLKPLFFGSDSARPVLAHAQRNIDAAGMGDFIHPDCIPVSALRPPAGFTQGLVISNPPYGERLGDREQVAQLYSEFGATLREHFNGWTCAILLADESPAPALGLRVRKRYALFNGALSCQLRIIDVQPPPQRSIEEQPLGGAAKAVLNRLEKNIRHLRRRLAREQISCWRAYDADIPEHAAAIDVYTALEGDPPTPDARPGSVWLHIQEYAPPASVPEHVARERLDDIVVAAARAFGVPRSRIAVKTRYRERGGSKYGRMDTRDQFLWVDEGGLRLRVNLFDYLDTGLFLDHRPTRMRIAELAHDTRFLNLFCYTATASVHAAAGNARSTTSVDLSATYLDWATKNMAANGFSGPAHKLIQADTMAWLAHDRGQYDLIFVDPPTFSNSKQAADFDVQQDHVRLLQLCARRLAPGGTIIFSNNFRRFRMDGDALEGLQVTDVSRASIPFDFARSPRIHQCFELRHADGPA